MKSITEIGAEDLVKAGLGADEAEHFQRIINDAAIIGGSDPAEMWRELTARRLLKPSHPHALHQLLYYTVYADWDASARGPPPYWFPSLYAPSTLHLLLLFDGSIPSQQKAAALLQYLRRRLPCSVNISGSTCFAGNVDISGRPLLNFLLPLVCIYTCVCGVVNQSAECAECSAVRDKRELSEC